MIRVSRRVLVPLLLVCAGVPMTSSAQVDCTTQPGNAILNCGFTSDTTWWGMVAGDGMGWTNADGDSVVGAAWVNSVDVAGTFTASISSTACISGPSPEFWAGASFKVSNGGSGATTCTYSVTWWLGTCSAVNDLDTGPSFAVGTSWVRSHFSFGSVGGENPVITLTCTDTVDFTVQLDDAFVASSWVPVELQGLSVD